LVYVLGARGKLHALSTEDGKPKWSHDLVAEYNASIPRWGVATEPLVEGERLIVNVGGTDGASVVAFDRSSGEETWRSYDDAAGYSAPIAVTVDGVRQIVVFTARHLVSLAADDGTVLWEIPWETSYDVNAATPLFVPPDRVFVSSGYDVGAALWRIQRKGDKLRTKAVWKNREMKNQFSSSVLVDGHLYGFDDATLKCLDAGTGERRWRERGLGHGSLIYADDRLYVLGERGTLVLVEANPEAYRERGRMELFEGKTWTPPSLAGGRLFVRDQRELVALDVTE
jgi:outer membrane protein assembly factor BamB